MKNHIVALFLIMCLSSSFGQDFLSIREETGLRERVEMEAHTAEAVFVAETADLTITTTNKSVDLVSVPVKQENGKYVYVVILDIGEGHFDRHFTVEKQGTTFRTSTKRKVVFAQGDRRYFIVSEPKVKFMLTQPEEKVHLVKNEACVEFYSPFPNLRVDTNGLLRARIETSVSEGGAFVTSVLVNTEHLDNLREVFQDSIPDYWAEMTTLSVRFDSSNANSVSVAGLRQRIKQRYNIVPVSGGGNKGSENLRLLTFNYSPAEAVVRLDGELLPAVHGRADAFVDPGVHHYDIECPYYHAVSDSVRMTGTAREIAVSLKPAFGYLKVTGQGVRGATVLINGEEVGTAPYSSDRLLSGKYTVELTRDLYLPYKKVVVIRDGETIEVTTSLEADYAHVTFAVGSDANIYVNDSLVGQGQYIADMRTGTYVIKSHKEGYTTTVDTIVITPDLMDRVIVLQTPTPIYGLLAIRTRPAKAMVWNKDTMLCQTPRLLRTLVGPYDLWMVKKGRDTVRVTAEVQQRRCLEVKASLPLTKKHVPDSCIKVKTNYVRHPVAYQKGFLLILHGGYAWEQKMPSFGLSIGQLRRCGWTLNFSTNFDFKGFNFQRKPKGSVPIDSTYTRLSTTIGFVVRTCNVLSVRVGAGLGYYTMSYKVSDQKWYPKFASMIVGLQMEAGVAFHVNPLMITLEVASTNFRYNEVRFGLGFCIHKRIAATPMKQRKDKTPRK